VAQPLLVVQFSLLMRPQRSVYPGCSEGLRQNPQEATRHSAPEGHAIVRFMKKC